MQEIKDLYLIKNKVSKWGWDTLESIFAVNSLNDTSKLGGNIYLWKNVLRY